VGLPNSGKSTLMNYLLDEPLSIINPKAQTTRQNIRGFVNEENYQIIFVDTPGWIEASNYLLQNTMKDKVLEVFKDSDLFLILVDIANPLKPDSDLVEMIKKIDIPKILLVSKMDLFKQSDFQAAASYYQSLFDFKHAIPISSQLNIGKSEIIDKILEYLPEHPPYFDKENYTDRNMRFIVSELIRQEILTHYQQEIPYASEVVIKRYQESSKGHFIEADIIVERETQKQIIIGHQGSKIKNISVNARKKISEYVDVPVHLYLQVKVIEGWRTNEEWLRRFGYLV
jgi:GTP-binding protein Era